MGKRKERQMAKLKQQSEPLWPHLRYATLSDVRKELPSALGAWGIISALTVGIGWAAQIAVPTGAKTWESPLPHWANYAIVCSIVLWFLRGQTFRVPRMSFGAWFGSSLYFAALCFILIGFDSPWWIWASALWGNSLLFSLLETLDAQGKENYDALQAARA
jgi:hypothetical protein